MEQWINQTLFLRTTSTPWFFIRVPPFFGSRDCHYHHLRKLHHRNYDWDNLQNYNNQTNIWIRSPETLVTLDSNNVLPTNEFRPNKSSQSQWISYFQCNCLEEGLAEEMLGWISQTGRVRSCITLWNSRSQATDSKRILIKAWFYVPIVYIIWYSVSTARVFSHSRYYSLANCKLIFMKGQTKYALQSSWKNHQLNLMGLRFIRLINSNTISKNSALLL